MINMCTKASHARETLYYPMGVLSARHQSWQHPDVIVWDWTHCRPDGISSCKLSYNRTIRSCDQEDILLTD